MSLNNTPNTAKVLQRIEETPTIFTLRLQIQGQGEHATYRFLPGQFNMLYLFGVGEIPISIVSDPQDDALLDHTIRQVGRVTRAMARLGEGDEIGIRGPYGSAWPLSEAQGKDVVIITGGLGCAPVVAAINYIMRRRENYGRVVIMQGVKHSADLLWRQRYEQWESLPDTQVILAANQVEGDWPWHRGFVTNRIESTEFDAANAVAMLCGPEPMMLAAIEGLCRRAVPHNAIWLSMERNMHCAHGRCGHCQIGPLFVCRDGPVLPYTRLKSYLAREGL